ncbi:MAG TPA: tripartite tricarboxylate transporter substrate-binding protein [Burkholderiales bacterium]|nr:tripartite tricarboxylate transporter substrate-binding protein [Burkholderiales bacterium]
MPTVAESGVPNYEFASWIGILAPAGTPSPVVGLLNKHIVSALRSPELSTTFSRSGMDVIASSPEQFATFLKSELQRYAKVVKERGLKAD